MGIHVEVPLPDGDSFRGYEATPDGASIATVLIVHEWFGLNEGIRSQADRFAAAGFRALAVDLYGGKVAGDAESARRLAAEMKTQHAMHVISAAAEHVRKRLDGGGKVCIAGFCLGGAVALAAAGHVEGFSAAATFCGMPPTRYRDVQRIHAPVMGHYGLRDPLLPVAQPRALFDDLIGAGKRAMFYAYDAGHAFMRDGSQSYHAAVAELAWQRTLGFFREAVAS
jgi:carboxymethylenebutenolidase